jgi:hypothetical protein
MIRRLVFAAAAVWGAAAGAVEPVYWRNPVFFLPYRPPADASIAIHKVLLLIARDGGSQWTVLQEAQPHVRGFSYHAPGDGEYSFAIQTSDGGGKLTPAAVAEPQIRVVVDSTQPTLELAAQLDATGRFVIRYEGRDRQLRSESLRLEAQIDGGVWQRLATGPPDVNQPDRVVGQLLWKPPTAAAAVRFRAAIEDRAANIAAATAEASLASPLLSPAAPLASPAAAPAPPADGPSLGPAAGVAAPGPTSMNPFDRPSLAAPPPPASAPPAASASASALTWPAANSRGPTEVAPPPLRNAYNPAVGPSGPTPAAPPIWPNQRTPAQLVADNGAASVQSSGASRDGNPFGAPPLFDGPPPLPPRPESTARPAAAPAAGWRSADAAPANAAPAETPSIRWVNATTFDVDYDLQTVGPWGVSKVELWATRDGGQEWFNFGADSDNRGPMRVTVPAAGVYGFRLVVTGATGASPLAPTPGDPPELTIGVDLTPPRAELQPVELGGGNLSDHLIVRWTASDENIDPRPTALFFSTAQDGPWTTIATDLENNGQYAWRLPQQLPERLFLRLEVRDRAGNIAVVQSPAPVALNVPQPTGRLRSVHPVKEPDSSTRYRTAAGASHAPLAQRGESSIGANFRRFVPRRARWPNQMSPVPAAAA